MINNSFCIIRRWYPVCCGPFPPTFSNSGKVKKYSAADLPTSTSTSSTLGSSSAACATPKDHQSHGMPKKIISTKLQGYDTPEAYCSFLSRGFEGMKMDCIMVTGHEFPSSWTWNRLLVGLLQGGVGICLTVQEFLNLTALQIDVRMLRVWWSN